MHGSGANGKHFSCTQSCPLSHSTPPPSLALKLSECTPATVPMQRANSAALLPSSSKPADSGRAASATAAIGQIGCAAGDGPAAATPPATTCLRECRMLRGCCCCRCCLLLLLLLLLLLRLHILLLLFPLSLFSSVCMGVPRLCAFGTAHLMVRSAYSLGGLSIDVNVHECQRSEKGAPCSGAGTVRWR